MAREVPPPTNGRPVGMRAVVWVATLAALIAGPALAARAGSTVARPEPVQLVAPAVAGWLGPHAAADGWRPSFEGAAGQMQVGYSSPTRGKDVELFHAVYTGKPRRGHSLITYGNNVYDLAKARILASSALRVELAGGASVAARELMLADAEGPRMVWYWYCVDSRCTASPALIKLLQAWDVLRGGDPRSSVWALSTRVANGDEAQARKDLRAFSRVLSAARGAKS